MSSNNSNFFNGSIDDVRVYNRALSVQEIQQLYAQGAANIDHSNTVALSSGLVGYWTFDGSQTNWTTGKTNDSSGKGNSGQLLGKHHARCVEKRFVVDRTFEERIVQLHTVSSHAVGKRRPIRGGRA